MDSLKQIRARLRDLRARVGNSIVEMGGIEVPAGEAEDGGLYHIDRAVADLTAHISGGYNSPSDLDGSTDDGSTDPEPVPSDSEPVFADDFSSGDLTHTENGYAWSGGVDWGVTAGVGRGGSHGMEITFPASADGDDSKSQANLDFGDQPTEVWVEYWMKVPSNFNHRDQSTGATNNKFFQIWGGGTRRAEPKAILEYRRTHSPQSGDDDEVWIRDGESGDPIANQFFSGYSNHYTAAKDHPFIAAADHGDWIQVRWHFKIGDHGSANSVLELWKNGSLWHSVTSYDDLTSSDSSKNYFDHIRLFGWSNSGFDEETTLVFDNVAIYTEDPGW